MLVRTVLAISLAIGAALGSAVSMSDCNRTPASSGNSTAGLRAGPQNIFCFSNIIENLMKLPHNLNFKNNFLGKYVRRQIDKIAKSWHVEIEIRIRKWQEMKWIVINRENNKQKRVRSAPVHVFIVRVDQCLDLWRGVLIKLHCGYPGCCFLHRDELVRKVVRQRILMFIFLVHLNPGGTCNLNQGSLMCLWNVILRRASNSIGKECL